MAGILEGLDIPKWMSPQEWSLHSEQAAESIGRNVSSAVGHALNLMGMLQNAQQQKDNLALRTQEFQLNQKVQTGTLELNRKKQELIQQAQLREQEDLKQMQFGAEQLHQGNFDWEPEKPWGSIKSAATWEKMKGGLMTATAVGQAQLRMNDDLGKMASFDPTIPAALDATAEVYGKGSKEWLEDFRSYKREMDAANEAKAAREFQMKQAAIGARQAMVIDEKGMWGEYIKNLGGRAPNKDTFLRQSIHDILAKNSADRKAAEAAGNPIPTTMTYEDAAVMAEGVWNRHITGQSNPSTNSPSSDPLGLFSK